MRSVSLHLGFMAISKEPLKMLLPYFTQLAKGLFSGLIYKGGLRKVQDLLRLSVHQNTYYTFLFLYCIVNCYLTQIINGTCIISLSNSNYCFFTMAVYSRVCPAHSVTSFVPLTTPYVSSNAIGYYSNLENLHWPNGFFKNSTPIG
jgi:hypothetical protein